MLFIENKITRNNSYSKAFNFFYIFGRNMRQVFLKISSITLALLIVLSTTTFAVEKHFCGDFLVDVSFFGEADSCFSEVDFGCIETEKITKKSCCKDELQFLDGQNNLKKASDDEVSFEQQNKFVDFCYSTDLLTKKIPDAFVPYGDYEPPKIIKDIQIFYEVYII